MVKSIAFILLLICLKSKAQNPYPTKMLLQKAFEEVMQPKGKKIKVTNAYGWSTCNTDSSFFKSDTLRFYTNGFHNTQQEECCNTMNWIFYRKNAFIQNRSQTCKEPSTASVVKNTDYNTIVIDEEEGYLVLKIFNNKTLKDQYKVLALESVPSSLSIIDEYILTLLRVKNLLH